MYVIYIYNKHLSKSFKGTLHIYIEKFAGILQKKCLNYKQTASWMQVLQVSKNIPNWMLCMQWNIYMNLYIFKNNMGRMHDFWNFLILRLRHVNTINSLQWLWSWFVKAYAPTDEGSKNLKISKILCIILSTWFWM